MRKEIAQKLKEKDLDNYKAIRRRSRQNYYKNNPLFYKALGLLSSYKREDKKHNRICNINTRWIVDNILNRECSYCNQIASGIDRSDNSIGHIKENCIPCCFRCNMIKGDQYTYKEMKEIGELLKVKDKVKTINQ